MATQVRGFGSNLELEKRAELAKHLYSWTNEYPADHRRPLDGFSVATDVLPELMCEAGGCNASRAEPGRRLLFPGHAGQPTPAPQGSRTCAPPPP